MYIYIHIRSDMYVYIHIRICLYIYIYATSMSKYMYEYMLYIHTQAEFLTFLLMHVYIIYAYI